MHASNKYIHYRKPVIRGVPKSSPCANHRAHGEESLCRGPNTEHTAQIKHTAKGGFAVCPNLSTRPTDFFAVCHRLANAVIFCHAPPLGTRRIDLFAVYHMEAHGKHNAMWPDDHGRSTPSYFAVCPR